MSLAFRHSIERDRLTRSTLKPRRQRWHERKLVSCRVEERNEILSAGDRMKSDGARDLRHAALGHGGGPSSPLVIAIVMSSRCDVLSVVTLRVLCFLF